MEYKLKRPCDNCPFRSDIPAYLTPARVVEIQRSLIRGEFSCHKTNDFDDESGDAIETDRTQHCAGALILMEKLGQSSQMMRICERIGLYDHTQLEMDAPVFDSFEKMIEAQNPQKRKRRKTASR